MTVIALMVKGLAAFALARAFGAAGAPANGVDKEDPS